MPYAIQTTDMPASGALRAKVRLFQKVTVTRWRKAYYNKQKFI